MCIVIDVCCIPKVFDCGNKHHPNYVPVFEWVFNGHGRMIYGGTKYAAELREIPRYLPIIAELERKGRAVEFPRNRVDAIADALKAEITGAAFNDEHLIAIVIVSRCRVVATEDRDAISYLKRRDFYSCHGVKKPKIYKSIRNSNLCCDQNIVANYAH
jgi:hypothetical protein